jgi:AcrR family transcriptional regulator
MRSKIVEKASELFLQLGFKTVTMDDIAAELAMSKKNYLLPFQ